MADADTNKITSKDGVTTPAGAPGGAGGASGEGSAGAPGSQRPQAAAEKEAPKFYVDGKSVSEERWLEAAAKSGYDLSYLKATPNYRPAISTKAHGEK